MTDPYWLVVASFILAGVPVFISLGTAYLKVFIVLGILRNGLGTQNTPGTMVIMALSLAITGIIMEPVLRECIQAIQQLEKESDQPVAGTQAQLSRGIVKYARALKPWKAFMLTHTGKRELYMFDRLRENRRGEKEPDPKSARIAATVETTPYSVLLPAFVTSELKEGFAMACALLLPFLVIDIAVSNILVGLGMYMVSPVLISLPIKLFVFVSVDGWLLVIQGLVRSYHTG